MGMAGVDVCFGKRGRHIFNALPSVSRGKSDLHSILDIVVFVLNKLLIRCIGSREPYF